MGAKASSVIGWLSIEVRRWFPMKAQCYLSVTAEAV